MQKVMISDIRAYIAQFETISIPQLQLHFHLGYEGAHLAINKLLEAGLIRYREGIDYEVLYISALPVKEKETDTQIFPFQGERNLLGELIFKSRSQVKNEQQ